MDMSDFPKSDSLPKTLKNDFLYSFFPKIQNFQKPYNTGCVQSSGPFTLSLRKRTAVGYRTANNRRRDPR